MANSLSHDIFEARTGSSGTWQPDARLFPVAASKHKAATRKTNPRERCAGTALTTSLLLR